MSGVYNPPEPRLLFGQFLLEKRKLTREILQKALTKQQHDAESSTVRESHRFLGQILLDDFGIFKNRVELNHFLIDFKDWKAKVEMERVELKNITRNRKHN